MKLTDELQNKIGNAKSEDEVKKLLGETKKNVEDAGVILDDAELDQVAGGMWGSCVIAVQKKERSQQKNSY